MDINEVHKIAGPMEGFISRKDGELLYRLARLVPSGQVIVEIGSWKGKSATYLAYGSMHGNNVPVYAVDHHTGSPEHRQGDAVWTYDDFWNNIRSAKVDHIVRPIVARSESVAPFVRWPIGLLFIDGEHSYTSVLADYRLWGSMVKPGGYIAFHDPDWAGVARLLNELKSTPHWKDWRREGGTMYAVRT